MPKAKAKKKVAEPSEPEHDPSWERSVISGVWDRPVTALPDAREWPTWGALRERILMSCNKIRITHTPSLRDAFLSELFKLSPENLAELEIRGSTNLRQLILSPLGSCPGLKRLDLSGCENLEYLLIQSESPAEVDCANCSSLKKAILNAALIHCPNLERLECKSCDALEVVMIWSAYLTKVDLTGSDRIKVLKTQCPSLVDMKCGHVQDEPVAVKQEHRPICDIVCDRLATD